MNQEQASPVVLWRLVCNGCFLGLTATIYFLAGRAGYVNQTWLNVAMVVAISAAALLAVFVFCSAWIETNRLGRVLGFFVLLVLLVELFLGLLPPTARDELTHHLALPRLYVSAGRIMDIPFAPYSYYPMLLDMLYVPFVRWGWDSVPKLVHGWYGFMTALLVYAYLGWRLNSVYGLLGVLFFVSTPIVLRLSNWAYVDLGLTFYSTAALLCLIQWAACGYGRVWLILAGLSAGFAFGTKPNGMLSVFLLSCSVLWMAGREGRGTVASLRALTLFVGVVLLSVSPWLVKNLSETGNPLYPFFSGFFADPTGSGGGAGESELGYLARRRFFYGESWWQIAALPLRIFFSGQDDAPQYFDGVLNPMLVVFLPWAFAGKWPVEKKLLGGFALFYFLYAFVLSDMRIRYVLPIVPPLVILSVYALHNMYLRVSQPAVVYGSVLFLLVLNGAYLWRYAAAMTPLSYLTGKESRESYLTRMLPDYAVFAFVNRHLPEGAKIYFIFMGRRGYYCNRDYFHDPGEHPWFLASILRDARGPQDVYRELAGVGTTHVLMREKLWGRFMTDNLTPPQHNLWESFVTRHLVGIYRDQDYSVYELHG